MTEFRKPGLTNRIPLPGGQDRLKQMILYVAQRCTQAERFGWVKLNKILWKADFDAYARRGIPVTGRDYQRLPLGPAPKEMRPLLREMQRESVVQIKRVDFGNDIVEFRTIALIDPDLSRFTEDDLRFVDNSIAYYWDMTGTETSDDSHGVAWRTHTNGTPLPYELARLSDKPLSDRMLERIISRAKERGWVTQ
jgi:hypothetical protein